MNNTQKVNKDVVLTALLFVARIWTMIFLCLIVMTFFDIGDLKVGGSLPNSEPYWMSQTVTPTFIHLCIPNYPQDPYLEIFSATHSL